MRPLIIGVAGGSGSGKTTVAQRVAEALDGSKVAFLDMDAYYRDHHALTHDELRLLNWDHPDAFDLDLLAEQLGRLAAGEAIEKPVYDFVRHRRGPTPERIEPADVIVIDGILLLVDERIRSRLDIKVFVDTDADIRLIRRIRRDMARRGRPLEEILDQYLTSVQPMHLQFVEPSKRYADLIIPRGGENIVAIDLLLAAISRRLGEVRA
ncbi:MAG: uridine kinase [Gemmatimonadaceae bacterium]|nr:uridine kinase [Gemmatimonadaceae bacterium]MCW5825699.1 uridine kinase [Gemmatimonadaceae bacterium]